MNSEVLITFKGDTKDIDSKTKSLNVSIGSIAKGVLAATGVTKALSSAWQMVSKNMDTAIDRYDTLNNFANVMKNLGIATEDSEEAVATLSDKLLGLPTTLQDGAMAVQRLTAKNGDIRKSTNLFLAMNNAILAGGAPMSNQQSALEQLTQAYSKGKPDMMEWRTMMTAMPAQLKQVATAMGYVDADALGTALREGSASMDDFMDTIVKLNTEGVNGLANFEEQARGSTGGIRTAITNMNSRIAAGVAEMISGVNKGLKEANMGDLATVLSNVGTKIKDFLVSLAPYITQFIVKLSQIGNWIAEHRTLLEAILIPLVAFIGTFSLIAKVISIINGLKNAFLILKAVIAAAGGPVTIVIAVIAALVAAFIYLWNHCEGFRNFWINLWEGIKNVFFAVVDWIKNAIDNIVNFVTSIPEKISNIVNSIINFIKNIPYYIGYVIGWIIGKIIKFYMVDIPNFVIAVIEWLKTLPEKISEIVNDIVNWFKELPGKLWSVITDVVGKVGQWFIDMWNKAKEEVPKLVNKIVQWFKELPGKMLEIGKNIIHGIWNGIKNAKDWLWNKITGFANGIVKGFKDALGIKSPSKEFAIVGRYSVLGYTEALDDMQSDVQKQVAETFAISPQLSATSGMHYSPNVNVVNNVDIQQDPLGQMVNSIKTYSGGAKNDFNYGAGL